MVVSFRGCIVKDVQKNRLLSWFLIWKKATAYKRIERQKKIEEDHGDRNLDKESMDEDEWGQLQLWHNRNNINKMILQNQIQIGLKLQKEVKEKQELIHNNLRYKMGGAVINDLLAKKSRVELKWRFKMWKQLTNYSN
jgi:hypothetical protein